jgi:hypothetical protein
MAITTAELARVRYIDYEYWSSCQAVPAWRSTPPRAFAPVRPRSEYQASGLGMAREVARGSRFPPLILATTDPRADPVVLEGHARLTAFMLARDQLPPDLEVLVGSSPAMIRWGLW